MNDVEPKFRCTACNRGVLNRAVSRCLFCGTALSAVVLLSQEEIAKRDAEHEALEADLRKRRERQPAPGGDVSTFDVYVDYSSLF